jgi:K(+)-stimulated pyrophosphate-energized sodium pump
MGLLYLALGAGLAALLFAAVTSQRVLREDTGNDTMRGIAALIQQGAAAFLRREYTFLAGFVVVVTAVIAVFVDYDATGKFAALGIVEAGGFTTLPRTAISYVLGAFASACSSPCVPTSGPPRRRVWGSIRRCVWPSPLAPSWA